jgi:hypothetical protein
LGEDGTRVADFYLNNRTGENSPLHRSFDDNGSHNETLSNTRPAAFPTNRPTLSILFGSEDSDDDEYEEHLKRYALDFRQSSSISTDSNNNSNSNTSFYYSIWSRIQEARQKARQRRTEYLLQQSERQTWRQSLYLFIMTTLCDATDEGIALMAIGLVAWIVMLWKLPENRAFIVWAGVVVWSIRFGIRPARHYWIQRRVRLHHQQRQREELRHYPNGADVGHGPDIFMSTANRFEDRIDSISFAVPESLELSVVSDGMVVS